MNVRVLALVFVLALALSYGLAWAFKDRPAEVWREVDRPASTQTPPQTRPPALPEWPACEPTPLPQRFADQSSRLGPLQRDGEAAQIALRVAGAPVAGGPRLTIVRSRSATTTTEFTREVDAAPDGTPTLSLLTVRLDPPIVRDRLVFITTACLPNRAARGAWWTHVPPTPSPVPMTLAAEVSVFVHLRAKLASRSPAFAAHSGLVPADLGVLAVAIPGCPRIAVVNSEIEPEEDQYATAVLCIDEAGEVLQAPRPPALGVPLVQLGVIDLDGDGIDELLVTIRTLDQQHHDELLWFDSTASQWQTHVLAPPRPAP